MATSPKTLNKPTVITRTPSTGQYDPFNPGGSTFQQQTLPTYTPATRAASGAVGNSPAAGAAQGVTGQSVNGVPQSFVDDISGSISKTSQDFYNGQNPNKGPNGQGVAVLSYQGKNYGIPLNPDGSFDQAGFSATVQQAWDATPADKKASYSQRDATNVAGQNQNQLQGIATQAALGGPAQNQAVANRLWGNLVDPAVAGANQTRAAQQTTDRQVEGDLTNATNTFTNTVNGNEATRMGGINQTNADNSKLSSDYMAETLAANGRNTGFANQLTDAANSTNANQTGLFNQYSGQMAGINANQTGLFNDFSGQMAGINANQTGLYNNFMGDISSANAQQNQNLSQFGGAVSSANGQSGQILNQFGGAVNQANNNQNQIVAQYSQQLASMNKQDQAAYLQYINETNPMMAQMIAQASNPEYVANQTNAIQQFKNNYNPEVTDQERFLAEQARRKFESDDKSSRDAVMSQLAGRGLRSGGLTIANQQATQQQLAQDRQMNELGLSANAVQRAERNRVDYSDASNALRNADDSMRHFQDTYAQQDAIRRSNLALDRNQQNLATTRQVSDRDASNYQARTQSNTLNYGRAQDYYSASRQTNNDIYGRNQDYYNASTDTVNNNFDRTQAGYDAGSQTNRDNATRDQWTFNAGTDTNTNNATRDQNVFDAGSKTNVDNMARTTGAISNQEWVNQGNLGNFGVATTNQQNTNTDNNTRTQGGLDKGNLAAGSILGAQTTLGSTKSTNRANEALAANNWVPVAAGTAETGTRIQQGLTREQQDAINALLGISTQKKAETALGLG